MSSETTTGACCKNCGTELAGPYCHKCGQHDFDFHRSFKHLVHEVLEDLFHFDGKFFKGIYDLLFRPGWLTNEFNAGRRARHMPPLRLYIFISLIYFLAPTSTDVRSSGEKELHGEEVKKELSTVAKEKSSPGDATFTLNGKDTEIGKVLAEKLEHKEEISEHFHHYIPKMILLCLPLFALLTRVVFWGSGLNYLQHLVLALHLHSFFFLFSLAQAGWVALARLVSDTAGSLLSLACSLYVVAYLYLTLRAVFGYGYSRLSVVFRSALVALSYTMILLIAALLTVMVAAAMI